MNPRLMLTVLPIAGLSLALASSLIISASAQQGRLQPGATSNTAVVDRIVKRPEFSKPPAVRRMTDSARLSLARKLAPNLAQNIRVGDTRLASLNGGEIDVQVIKPVSISSSKGITLAMVMEGTTVEIELPANSNGNFLFNCAVQSFRPSSLRWNMMFDARSKGEVPITNDLASFVVTIAPRKGGTDHVELVPDSRNNEFVFRQCEVTRLS